MIIASYFLSLNCLVPCYIQPYNTFCKYLQWLFLRRRRGIHRFNTAEFFKIQGKYQLLEDVNLYDEIKKFLLQYRKSSFLET